MAKRIMQRAASDNVYRHPDFHGALSTGIEYLDAKYGPEAVREYLRLKLQARRQIKRIADLEQEIHGLRTLPIASASVIAGASSAPKA